MPILRTITSGLLSRHTAKRVARVIPNPILRFIVVSAATAVVPVVVNRVAQGWRARRAHRAHRAHPLASARHA